MARLTAIRRLTIVAIYVVVYWIALPLLLIALGWWLDTTFALARAPSWWGLPFLIGGLAFLGWAALWLRVHGHGLPISALPPPKLVVTGPYQLVRHPMYVGYQIALLGLALVIGSPGVLIVAGPVFLALWVTYAIVEERGLRRRFGIEYQAYQAEVALWPRLPLYQIVQALVAARVLPVTVEGSAHVPRGACVMVANHTCYLDPAILTRLTRRRIRFLATAEAFRPRLFGWALRRAGAIPLHRFRVDPIACRTMMRRLSYGEIVGLFVEGERSPLGMYEGAMPRTAGIIARLGIPVIPVGILGAYDVGPRWADVLRRRPVSLRMGPPIVFNRGQDPAQAIDAAICALLDTSVGRVHLTGLPRERLRRVLWACPRCLHEEQWDVATLQCSACGARYAPTSVGLFLDGDGQTHTLAKLGHPLLVGDPPIPEIVCAASARCERLMLDVIQPLAPAGVGMLRLTRETLTFAPNPGSASGSLTILLRDIRSATTERADTLQVATRQAVWQFTPETMSVFRLHHLILVWARPRLERLTSAPLDGSSREMPAIDR